MLAVSPLRNPKNERENQMEKIFSSIENQHIVEFPDFSSDNLLDSIDFDDLFVGINGGDLLPDLEMESPDIREEFTVSAGEDTISEVNMPSIVSVVDDDRKSLEKVGPDAASGSSSVSDHGSGSEEAVSKSDRELVAVNVNPLPKEGEKGRKKSTRNTKKTHGKRKVKKVDWTPELHRRFVQAVEQLGVDKAVPSRILQLIGIDCLTRHNIASHLQKYRSHRKHLIAREAEAASWNRRQQMCRRGGAAARKGDHVNPWIAPTIGYPSMAPMPHFRPLYVWGHPSVDQSLMPMWPKHLPPPPPMHAWPPAQPPRPSAGRHSYWIPHHHRWYSTPPVPGVPPPGLASGHTLFRPPSDAHPSKESVDAAIGDVLSKPWLPLPLGLKPPSVDSVMVELHRQGISKIPPANLCLIN